MAAGEGGHGTTPSGEIVACLPDGDCATRWVCVLDVHHPAGVVRELRLVSSQSTDAPSTTEVQAGPVHSAIFLSNPSLPVLPYHVLMLACLHAALGNAQRPALLLAGLGLGELAVAAAHGWAGVGGVTAVGLEISEVVGGLATGLAEAVARKVGLTLSLRTCDATQTLAQPSKLGCAAFDAVVLDVPEEKPASGSLLAPHAAIATQDMLCTAASLVSPGGVLLLNTLGQADQDGTELQALQESIMHTVAAAVGDAWRVGLACCLNKGAAGHYPPHLNAVIVAHAPAPTQQTQSDFQLPSELVSALGQRLDVTWRLGAQSSATAKVRSTPPDPVLPDAV